jgi:hypothetical protein
MISFAAQRLMELEVERLTRGSYGEKAQDRLVQRNGYRIAIGRRVPALSSCASRSCARAPTSQASWNGQHERVCPRYVDSPYLSRRSRLLTHSAGKRDCGTTPAGPCNVVTAQQDRIVASNTLLANVGRLSPVVLGLPTQTYEPQVHYMQVRDAWAGTRNPDG